jgi:hypothetical protein
VPATPTPETIAPAPVDPQGDTGSYDTGAPVEGIPVGIDLSAASLGPEGQAALQPTGGVPAGLDGWVAEGEMLLWVTLYEAIPSPPAAYMSWLFALDIDGSMATGRPPGSRRINPDLGDEAVLGVSYDPNTGTYDSYFYAWDSAQGGWVTRSEGVRYIIDDSRTIVAFALPLDAFTQAVTETSGVTLVTEAVKGRAAAESYVGDQRVIDFYPDVP